MEIEQAFFHQFLMMYRPFEQELNKILNENDLHRAQWTILFYLYHFGPATSVTIAKYISVERPTIARTFKSLTTLNYVEPIIEDDRRKKQMQLTAKGKALYENIRIKIDAFEADILAGVSEENQRVMIEMMKTIRSNIAK